MRNSDKEIDEMWFDLRKQLMSQMSFTVLWRQLGRPIRLGVRSRWELQNIQLNKEFGGNLIDNVHDYFG